jgi:hypothetical protein
LEPGEIENAIVQIEKLGLNNIEDGLIYGFNDIIEDIRPKTPPSLASSYNSAKQ